MGHIASKFCCCCCCCCTSKGQKVEERISSSKSERCSSAHPEQIEVTCADPGRAHTAWEETNANRHTSTVTNDMPINNAKKQKKKIKQLQRRNDNMETENNDIREKLQKEIQRCRNLVNVNEALIKERDELANRYSAIASAQLTNNNPDIVDLSDANRPTKIAEQYSELYDNEWTNAFGVLEKNGFTEKEAISKLLEILICLFQICQQEAKRQLRTLKHFGGMDKLPITVLKTLKETRKANFESEISRLKKHQQEPFREHLSAELLQEKDIEKYIDTCLRLCWLMSIQDPPLHMDVKPMEGETFFEKKYYRSYTRSGEMVDYYIWPALFLHENGGMLTKGTAQGKSKAVGPAETDVTSMNDDTKPSKASGEAHEQVLDEAKQSPQKHTTEGPSQNRGKEDEHNIENISKMGKVTHSEHISTNNGTKCTSSMTVVGIGTDQANSCEHKHMPEIEPHTIDNESIETNVAHNTVDDQEVKTETDNAPIEKSETGKTSVESEGNRKSEVHGNQSERGKSKSGTKSSKSYSKNNQIRPNIVSTSKGNTKTKSSKGTKESSKVQSTHM